MRNPRLQGGGGGLYSCPALANWPTVEKDEAEEEELCLVLYGMLCQCGNLDILLRTSLQALSWMIEIWIEFVPIIETNDYISCILTFF